MNNDVKCAERERESSAFSCALVLGKHYISHWCPKLTEFKKTSFDVGASIILHSSSLCHITAAAAKKVAFTSQASPCSADLAMKRWLWSLWARPLCSLSYQFTAHIPYRAILLGRFPQKTTDQDPYFLLSESIRRNPTLVFMSVVLK